MFGIVSLFLSAVAVIVLSIVTISVGSAIWLLIVFLIADHEYCIEHAKDRYQYSQCH